MTDKPATKRLENRSGGTVKIEFGGMTYLIERGKVVEVPADLADHAQLQYAPGVVIVHRPEVETTGELRRHKAPASGHIPLEFLGAPKVPGPVEGGLADEPVAGPPELRCPQGCAFVTNSQAALDGHVAEAHAEQPDEDETDAAESPSADDKPAPRAPRGRSRRSSR